MGLLDILARQNPLGLFGGPSIGPIGNLQQVQVTKQNQQQQVQGQSPYTVFDTGQIFAQNVTNTNNRTGFVNALIEKYPKAEAYIQSLWSDLQMNPKRLYAQQQQKQPWQEKTWVNESGELVQVDPNTLAPTLTDGNTTPYRGDIKQHKLVQVLRGESPVPAGADKPVRDYFEGHVNLLKSLQSAGTGNWLEMLPLLGALPGGVIDPAQIIQLAIMQAEREKKGEIWEQLKSWYDSFGVSNCDSVDESDKAICNLMKTTIRNFVSNLLMQTWMPRRPTTGSTLGTRSSGGGLGDAFSTLITLMMFKDLLGKK
jgi:hypothetical protein